MPFYMGAWTAEEIVAAIRFLKPQWHGDPAGLYERCQRVGCIPRQILAEQALYKLRLDDIEKNTRDRHVSDLTQLDMLRNNDMADGAPHPKPCRYFLALYPDETLHYRRVDFLSSYLRRLFAAKHYNYLLSRVAWRDETESPLFGKLFQDVALYRLAKGGLFRFTSFDGKERQEQTVCELKEAALTTSTAPDWDGFLQDCAARLAVGDQSASSWLLESSVSNQPVIDALSNRPQQGYQCTIAADHAVSYAQARSLLAALGVQTFDLVFVVPPNRFKDWPRQGYRYPQPPPSAAEKKDVDSRIRQHVLMIAPEPEPPIDEPLVLGAKRSAMVAAADGGRKRRKQ